MLLKNHIATRFLTDISLTMELLELLYPEEYKIVDSKEKIETLSDQFATTFRLADKEGNVSYYVTETIIDKLQLLKVKKIQHMEKEQYDWTVFKNVKHGKRTFIFPDGTLLRMLVNEDTIQFLHISVRWMFNKNEGMVHFILFYVDQLTGEQCEHFAHNDVRNIEEFIYKLLCFVYLSDNTEKILAPGEKSGTKKSGKIINTLPFPLTIINSNWNITSIRNEEFGVSGHLALRWVGQGRTEKRMVWIDPYLKHGYIRKAKNVNS